MEKRKGALVLKHFLFHGIKPGKKNLIPQDSDVIGFNCEVHKDFSLARGHYINQGSVFSELRSS